MTRHLQRPREEQTELDEPIKIRFGGRLRDIINERTWDSVCTKQDDEWVIDTDAEEYMKNQARPVRRQKTNVVFETVEEASAFHHSMGHYATDGVTWMNGMMRKSIRRVRRELRQEMEEQGYPPVHAQTKWGSEFRYFDDNKKSNPTN